MGRTSFLIEPVNPTPGNKPAACPSGYAASASKRLPVVPHSPADGDDTRFVMQIGPRNGKVRIGGRNCVLQKDPRMRLMESARVGWSPPANPSTFPVGGAHLTRSWPEVMHAERVLEWIGTLLPDERHSNRWSHTNERAPTRSGDSSGSAWPLARVSAASHGGIPRPAAAGPPAGKPIGRIDLMKPLSSNDDFRHHSLARLRATVHNQWRPSQHEGDASLTKSFIPDVGRGIIDIDSIMIVPMRRIDIDLAPVGLGVARDERISHSRRIFRKPRGNARFKNSMPDETVRLGAELTLLSRFPAAKGLERQNARRVNNTLDKLGANTV